MLKVAFRPGAAADLNSLYGYIASRSGMIRAGEYLDRIEVAIQGLGQFPESGRLRDDIAPGLRTLAFERRVLIGYRIEADQIEIIAILYGGRNLTPDFTKR